MTSLFSPNLRANPPIIINWVTSTVIPTIPKTTVVAPVCAA